MHESREILTKVYTKRDMKDYIGGSDTDDTIKIKIHLKETFGRCNLN